MLVETPLSTAKAAEMLGVSRSTLLGLARDADNPLPSIKIGTHYRFFWSDIVKYFKIPEDKTSFTNVRQDLGE